MSWGYQNPTAVRHNQEDYALMFQVDGNHFKGWVIVSLNFMDLYDVEFYDNASVKQYEVNDIYAEDLANIIDENVEKVPEYTR